MSSINDMQRLNQRLSDPQARSRFKTNQIRELIASQIRLLREEHDWTQAELGERAGGVPQPRVSRLEDPDNAGLTLKTLVKLSDAFDVGLVVRFVPFSELIQWTVELSPEKLTPPSYNEEHQLMFAGLGPQGEGAVVTTSDVRIIVDLGEQTGAAGVSVPVGSGIDYEERQIRKRLPLAPVPTA